MSVLSYPQKDFSEKNLYSSVLVDLPSRFPASGFYYVEDSIFYLVSAKHVLLDSLDQLLSSTCKINSPQLFEPDSLLELTLILDTLMTYHNILYTDSIDMAIVRLGIVDTVLKKISWSFGIKPNFRQSFHVPHAFPRLLKYYKDVNIGNEVFILGYPSSLGIKSTPQFNYNFPLLRKGIIAGKYDASKTLILDCPVYYGNSGSPVFECDYSGDGIRFYLIGIVIQYIPFDEFWANRKIGQPNVLLSNSGYSIALPIDNLIFLLKNSK